MFQTPKALYNKVFFFFSRMHISSTNQPEDDKEVIETVFDVEGGNWRRYTNYFALLTDK